MKKIEYFFKNILLKFLLIFNPVKKDSAIPSFNSNSVILFIRLNRIGDALVTTPLLYEIKNQIGCKIIVLADPRNHFVFHNNPSVDEVIVYKKGFNGIIGINNIVKEKNINAIIDLHDDVSTTVSFLVALAKVKYKLGLSRSNNSIFTHTIEKLNPSKFHVIDRNLELGKLFNIKINKSDVSVRFYPPEEAIKKAKSELAKMNPQNQLLVGINISAGSEARFWGVDNYQKVIDALAGYEIKVVLFCSESDYQLAQQIIEKDNIYPPTKDFGNFASAIMNLNFLITPDTSVVHIASINKIPLFGIYVKYNTDDMIWSPYNTEFDCVITEEPTLKNMSFELVKNKLIPFLEKQLNVKANTRL